MISSNRIIEMVLKNSKNFQKKFLAEKSLKFNSNEKIMKMVLYSIILMLLTGYPEYFKIIPME